MKVLLSAFSCGPGRGSEPGVGWNWVCQISRRHELWLITSDEYREEVSAQMPPNAHVVFIPSYKTWERLKISRIAGLDWIYYYWWQWKAYRAARRLHDRVHFDLAHHVTFASWRAPSFLSLLPVPFIWGPVGGGERIPRAFWGELGIRGRLFEGLRECMNRLSRFDPAVLMTMRRAARIIVTNEDTGRLVERADRAKVRKLLAIGTSAVESTAGFQPGDRPKGFVVVMVALLRSWKGGSLALRALQALTRQPELNLVIIGGGSDRARLAALADQIAVASRVRFLGGLPRAQVLGWIKSADTLLLPSLRDSGGQVLMEAMALGKPVVCLDLGGPAEIVSDECGFKIRPGSPEQVISDLASALEKLAANPMLRQKMGNAGRERIERHFDWDKRGERMMEIYEETVGEARAGSRC